MPSLKVSTSDSRFSVQIEGTAVQKYGRAADCIWRESCTAYTTIKKGKTESNLAGTDFKFPLGIPYVPNSYPRCGNVLVEPTMSADQKKISVRCGGYCGGCSIPNLVLELDGCSG